MEIEVQEGDRIMVPDYIMGHRLYSWSEFTVVKFRCCLGIFSSEESKEAGHLIPLSNLYEPGPESQHKYIPNYGEYMTNLVPKFILLAG